MRCNQSPDGSGLLQAYSYVAGCVASHCFMQHGCIRIHKDCQVDISLSNTAGTTQLMTHARKCLNSIDVIKQPA